MSADSILVLKKLDRELGSKTVATPKGKSGSRGNKEEDFHFVKANKVFFSPHYFLFAGRPDQKKAKLADLLAAFDQKNNITLIAEKSIYQRIAEIDNLNRKIVGVDIRYEIITTEEIQEQLDIYLSNLHPKSQVLVLMENQSSIFKVQEYVKDFAKQHQQELAIVDIISVLGIAGANKYLDCWIPLPYNIYPIDVPDIKVEKNLDVLLLDCPARNLSLMPNGFGYVHNVLKQMDINFQTFDLDIVTYHRFHISRIYDWGGTVTLDSGRELALDPWKAEHYDLWSDQEVIAYFMPVIDEMADRIITAHPKVVMCSLQGNNEAFTRHLINKVRAACPEIIFTVGGFSCYNADIGLRGFPECDYMFIGESDLTVEPLISELIQGNRPKNLPGILAHHDDPDRLFTPAPMPHELDVLEPPKYEWFDLSVYRNQDNYQLTPIIASRGCRWSRCSFCAERFYWRIRSAENFVDELEWFIDQGCTLFMFNESDLNGAPERLLEICDEIIRRRLKIRLTGQLRIHKKSDRAFFQKLAQAGFVALRFGVDAFSRNTLKLQAKGYTPETVSQNLKDCWESGIYTEINWVIGVPGETMDDVREGIDLILSNRNYIGRVANINPLMLVNGSVYWIDPEGHNIHFKVPKEELYKNHPRIIPSDLWYSTEPYIDSIVRKHYFDTIILSLHKEGFPLGDWAARLVENVKNKVHGGVSSST